MTHDILLATVPWEQLADAWLRSDDFWDKTGTFLSLTLRGLGLVLLLGIPAGILLSRLPRLAGPVVTLLALVQPIPSLALIGLLFSVVPIGAPAALVAAVVYSLFPVVLNTHVGITQVAPPVKDAARGMGMTGRQVLLHVELPLALPVIVAGLRIATVTTIGLITITALIGEGGLGQLLYDGLQRDFKTPLVVGSVLSVALAVVADLSLAGLQRFLTPWRAA